jgi:hypothetical protein
MVLAGKITGIRENPVPVPIYPPKIPQKFVIAVTGRATNCLSHGTSYTRYLVSVSQAHKVSSQYILLL